MPRQLLFLPGNPGNCGFYEELLRLLRTRFDVVGIDYPGHAPGTGAGTSLNELVAHVHQRVNQVLRPGAVLVGHSFGAYVVGQLLTKGLNHKPYRTVLLHPALVHLAQTPAGTKIKPRAFRTLAPLTKLVPNPVLSTLARRPVPRQALSTKYVRQHLRLWQEEKKAITTPGKWLSKTKNLLLFVNPNDGWTPPEAVQVLQNCLRTRRTRVAKRMRFFQVPHDFGGSRQHCRTVFTLLSTCA